MSCELPNAAQIISCVNCPADGQYDMNSLLPGQTARLTATISLNGVETDPSTLTLTVTDPLGAETEYVYGVDANVFRTTDGVYYADVVVPLANASVGSWQFRWETTGDFAAFVVGAFTVYDAPDQLIVQLHDSLAAPVVGARVQLLNAAGYLSASGKSDSLGQVTFSVTNGSYTIDVTLAGWRFPSSPYAMTAAATVIVVGADLQIATAPTVELCRLYGSVIESSGTGVEVFVEPVGENTRAFANLGASGVNRVSAAIVRERRSIRTRGADGFWEAELVQGSMVRVTIPAIQWERVFRVPAQSVLSAADIRPDPGAATIGRTGVGS